VLLDKSPNVVEQVGQMELGRLASPAGGGIVAGDAGAGFALGLAEGIAAPAEAALGLALAEAQLLHSARHVAATLSPAEGVGGLSNEPTHFGTQFHSAASWRQEADNVQESVG
jgi:hypothetical protein